MQSQTLVEQVAPDFVHSENLQETHDRLIRKAYDLKSEWQKDEEDSHSAEIWTWILAACVGLWWLPKQAWTEIKREVQKLKTKRRWPDMWSTIGLFVSLLVGVLGVHFGFILCNDHLAAFLMSLVLARWTYLAFGDLQSLVDEDIDTPQPKSCEISELDAMAAVRETLTYTSLGDRWWHIRDMNLDDGRLLASVTLEAEHGRFSDVHFSKERVIASTQIVLIVEVSRSTSKHVSVRLRFVVTASMGRKLATSVIKSMQEALDEALERRAAKNKPIEEGIAV